MINIIVAACTVIGVAFLLMWFVRPAFRTQVELPKYLMLANEYRFSQKHDDLGAHPKSLSEELRPGLKGDLSG